MQFPSRTNTALHPSGVIFMLTLDNLPSIYATFAACTIGVNIGNPVTSDVEMLAVLDEFQRTTRHQVPQKLPMSIARDYAPVNSSWVRQVAQSDGNDVFIAFHQSPAEKVRNFVVVRSPCIAVRQPAANNSKLLFLQNVFWCTIPAMLMLIYMQNSSAPVPGTTLSRQSLERAQAFYNRVAASTVGDVSVVFLRLLQQAERSTNGLCFLRNLVDNLNRR